MYHMNNVYTISDQFDILMDKNFAFLSKTRTFLSDPKLLNGSVGMLGSFDIVFFNISVKLDIGSIPMLALLANIV